MKILHVETGMKLYGGAFQVKLIIDGLQARGIGNVLVCPEGSEIANHFRHGACTLEEIPCGGDADFLLIPRIARLLRQHKPDLVHLHSRRGADIMGGIAAKLTATPCVLSRRVDNPESPLWCRVKYALYNHVISISEAIRQVLLTQGVPPDHVTCVRSALDSSAFDRAANLTRLHELIPQAEGKRVIGMMAQFIPRKGHHLLMDAIPAILQQHSDVHFALFGQGRIHAEITERIAREQLQEFVSAPGFIADINEVLPTFYALVHPAYREGLGVSLLQASAAGVPIVACAAGGIVEAVKQDVNGFLVPPGNKDALAEKLTELLDHPELRGEMSTSGREFVQTHFSPDIMVRGNLAVYNDVLNPPCP